MLKQNGNNKILFVQDEKFKNFKFILSFKTPLDKKTATLNALLVKVLLDGCEKYPTKKEISTELKKLYGASLSANCVKKEFSLCPTFEFDCISEKFSEENIISKALKMFKEILLCPLLQDGAFKSDYVEREKKVLINDIEGAQNDKRRYAARRCLEICCGDNPYGVFELGDTEICRTITPKQLYEHYKYIISSCAYSAVAVGNFAPDKMKVEAEKLFAELGSGENFAGEAIVSKGKKEIVKEPCDITQGKLSMAFVTGEINSSERYAWQVLNGLFGGGVSSKLFNNVREKMSLCYYASSTFYRNIGVILANAGIDFENFEKTADAVAEQLSDITKGEFTDTEFENVKTGISNNLKMAGDDIDTLANYYVFALETDEVIPPEEKAEKINLVKRELVEKLSRQIKLETVYFLCGREEGEK